MSNQQAPSIFDAIGGRGAVSAAVDIFYERVLADDALAPFFADTDMRRLRGHQAAFLAMALGGPNEYRGRAMAEAHRGLNIADEDFDRVAGHLVATLEQLGVPGEMVSTIVGKVAPLREHVVTRRVAAAA